MSKLWCDERSFEEIVETTVPNPLYKSKVDDLLLYFSVEEQFGFKGLKSLPVHTVYDAEVGILAAKKKSLELQTKKEEEIFEKLLKELKGFSDESSSSEDLDEDDSESEKKKPKKKGFNQAKHIKTSLAVSQQKRIDLQKELEDTDSRMDHYKSYQYANQCYLLSLRKLCILYEKTKNVDFLTKGLYRVVAYHEMLKHRYISSEPCSGEAKTLCRSHHLPMEDTRCIVYSNA